MRNVEEYQLTIVLIRWFSDHIGKSAYLSIRNMGSKTFISNEFVNLHDLVLYKRDAEHSSFETRSRLDEPRNGTTNGFIQFLIELYSASRLV